MKEESTEAMFSKALEVAEKHLENAMKDGGVLSAYVAVAMVEAAVNAAAENTDAADIADMLRDLADQIDSETGAGDEDDDDLGADNDDEEDA
ncbi:MAG: hypothetical protein M3O22_05155 [Pseudomonadota bacterium]|nr:hypothetical protein [Pseudomonadota bacterium]